MADYIERGAAYKFTFDIPNPNGAGEIEVVSVDDLEAISAADVRPVVLCKDCDLSYETVGGLTCPYWVCVDCAIPEDFFCAYGQKSEASE